MDVKEVQQPQTDSMDSVQKSLVASNGCNSIDAMDSVKFQQPQTDAILWMQWMLVASDGCNSMDAMDFSSLPKRSYMDSMDAMDSIDAVWVQQFGQETRSIQFCFNF